MERDRVDAKGVELSFEQITGDLKNFSGWRCVRPNDRGAIASFEVEFDLGIPMLAPVLHPVATLKLRENGLGMLTARKGRLESGDNMDPKVDRPSSEAAEYR